MLVSLADRVVPGETFVYLETHSGAPMHTLSPGGEWLGGIRAALDRPDAGASYFAIAEAYVNSGRYPAGWLLFATRACGRVGRLTIQLHDIQADVAARYKELAVDGCPVNAEVRFTRVDGFSSLNAATKPDLVFLDPPFSPDAEADWKRLACACRTLAAREVPFVAWYPFYWPTQPQRLIDGTGQASWEVHWAQCGAKPSQNLKGCGMLVSKELRPVLESASMELAETAVRLKSRVEHRMPTGS